MAVAKKAAKKGLVKEFEKKDKVADAKLMKQLADKGKKKK